MRSGFRYRRPLFFFMEERLMLRDLTKSPHAIEAMKNFTEGYNCAQSLVLSFSDYYEMDKKTAARIASGFGGGMGRLREVGGAVTGMFMVLGLVYGYDDPKEYEKKTELYKMVQDLANDFEETNGSILCRDLLGLTEQREEATPSKRTEKYYEERPCEGLIGQAAALLEEYLENLADKS
jgi:C_GCAxxG_C_C family probable redox protein